MAEYIAHLIELVEPHRCLYEKAHHLYYNVKYKEKIWKEIAGKWTVVAGKQMTVEDAKKKWASARDRYHRLKKAADLPSGSAADDGTVWEHMKPLQFLDSITEQRPTQSNFNESDSQNAEETAANASASFASSEHPEAQHKKRRKKGSEHERQERGPFFFWAMDIAKSLEVLPRPTGLKLKMNISQMIFEAQLLEERENQFEHTAVEDFDGGGFEGRRFEEDHFDEDGFEENSIYRFGAAACISTEPYFFAMRVRRILLLKKKIALLLLMHHARRPRSIVCSTRRTEGEYSTLMKILVTDETAFFRYLRMKPATFRKLKELVTPFVKPRVVRSNVVYHIEDRVEDVSRTSSEQEWRDIARGFEERWSFPHVLGCIDGKHIKLKKPAKSGSNYFNRKKDFSTVLLAVADSRYKFIYYDLGEFGHNHDSTIFQNSSLGVALSNKELDLPEDASRPDSTRFVPYFFLGDGEATDYQETFNYRLSHARRVIENAFGILCSRWRILLKHIETDVVTSDWIVRCTLHLHNFLSDEEPFDERTIIAEMCPLDEAAMRRVNANRSSEEALQIRNTLADYFINEGSVPWQYSRLRKAHWAFSVLDEFHFSVGIFTNGWANGPERVLLSSGGRHLSTTTRSGASHNSNNVDAAMEPQTPARASANQYREDWHAASPASLGLIMQRLRKWKYTAPTAP
ncbi:hypothetical protein QR680_005093 [Steinernema hermaphroditum]|uniref:MADF domain-containing protein n=1 Tax=Steinernema hermaphroditum TaxID=289476 RepID=A0AA39HS18_9BILA|nr:hypothetical protein QR680_005093 [Steinernema hermaphroditum]